MSEQVSVNFEERLHVTIHHEDGSLWAEVAEMPGCFATGDTQEELAESLQEAIQLYLTTDGQVAGPVSIQSWEEQSSEQEITLVRAGVR